jgi:hypothetical protein
MDEPKYVELDEAVISKLMLDARDKLHAELLKISQICTANNPDWRPALLGVFSRYLEEIGFDVDVALPIKKLQYELAEETLKARGKIADNEMPVNRSIALNVAAAILDILVRRKVYPKASTAEDSVSKATGINGRMIRDHRNALGRGMRPQHVKDAYEKAKADLSSWSTEDLLSRAAVLKEFM